MILHAYFARRFVGAFLTIAGIFLGILVLIDLVDQVRRFEAYDVSFPTLVGLTFLSIPGTLYTILPLITVIATLTLFLGLARTSELVVSRASGRSAIISLFGPVLVTFLIGVLSVIAFNPIVAATSARYEQLSDGLRGVTAPTLSVGAEGVWLRQGNPEGGQTVINAEGVSGGGTLLTGVGFFAFDRAGTAISRITAASAQLGPEGWTISDGKSWDFTGDNPEARATRFETLELPTTLSPDYIADSFADPDSIPIWKLPGFINELDEAGFSADRHRVFFQSELTLPFMLVAMTLVGAGFTMRHTRFGRTGRMVLAALGTGFSLFFLQDFAQILGENGQISPILAAWGPPVASLCLPLALILHWEDG